MPLKCFISQNPKICPPTCHREERGRRRYNGIRTQRCLQERRLSLPSINHLMVTGGGPLVTQPTPARLTSGLAASLKRRPIQKGGGAATSTIEVTRACATLVLSSYSIYSISIVDHRHQRGRGGDNGGAATSRREQTRPHWPLICVPLVCRRHVG